MGTIPFPPQERYRQAVVSTMSRLSEDWGKSGTLSDSLCASVYGADRTASSQLAADEGTPMLSKHSSSAGLGDVPVESPFEAPEFQVHLPKQSPAVLELAHSRMGPVGSMEASLQRLCILIVMAWHDTLCHSSHRLHENHDSAVAPRLSIQYRTYSAILHGRLNLGGASCRRSRFPGQLPCRRFCPKMWPVVRRLCRRRLWNPCCRRPKSSMGVQH